MILSYKLQILLVICCSLCILQVDSDAKRSLSRRRRYVVFPEGSSFSIALCMTIHTLTPDDIFTEGLNWGISYDLPNESKPGLEPFLELRKDKFKINKKINKIPMENKNNYLKYGKWNNDGKYYLLPSKKKTYKTNYHYLQRRHRRDLYNKLEVVMNAMGFDGRTCILRALCEASQRLMPKGNTLVEEMMRIAFSLPLRRVFSFEPDEHHTYTNAHKAGHEGQNCEAMFPGCTFSLIDMALGKYNTPEDPPYNQDTSERVTETSDTRALADFWNDGENNNKFMHSSSLLSGEIGSMNRVFYVEQENNGNCKLIKLFWVSSSDGVLSVNVAILTWYNFLALIE